jgi:OmpR-family two-component system manganese-sensing response regulator
MTDSSRILFVDDDEDSCQMMSIMLNLTDENFAVTLANTAEQALALIETQQFDMFILDYRLPDLTGVELCGRIRQIDSRTPIMFYSGMAREIDRQSAKTAGADEYLIKPNDLNRIPETIQRYLNSERPS